MIPRWFYTFNQWLMIVSLALLGLLILAGLVSLPFLDSLPLGFLRWWAPVMSWGLPGLIALFAASSGIVVNGFIEHRTVREKAEK